MAERRQQGGTGTADFNEREARRERERQEAGLEPEQHPGPRQNEGISSAGRLYATQEEANAESDVDPRAERKDVDREAAMVRGDGPREE